MPDPRQFTGGLLAQGAPQGQLPVAPQAQQPMPPGQDEAAIQQLMQLPPQEVFKIYMQAPPEVRQIMEQVPELMQIIQAFSEQNQQQGMSPPPTGVPV